MYHVGIHCIDIVTKFDKENKLGSCLLPFEWRGALLRTRINFSKEYAQFNT